MADERSFDDDDDDDDDGDGKANKPVRLSGLDGPNGRRQMASRVRTT